MEAKTETQIEYEEVIIRLPKAIMDFLRSCEKALKMTAKEYIEYNVVLVVKADIDDETVFMPSPEQIVKDWNLNPIFKQILNDPLQEQRT